MKITLLGSGSYKSSLTYLRLIALGQQLGKRGWRVSVIAPSADKYNNFTPDRTATLPDVELVQPWQPTTHNIFINLLPYLFTSSVALLRRRPHLVYLYKPTPITIIGLLPKLLFRTPVVVDLDDLGSEVMRLEGQSPLQVRLVSWCERLALRYADAAVVASTYLRDMVRSRYPSKSILLLSNGVDLEEYPLLPSQPPRHALYYFGAFNRLSLIEPLLSALPETLRRVPNTRVYMLGGGSALETVRARVAELGLAEHVTFSGWISKDDLPRYVQFADIALCTQPDIPTVRAASNMKVFQYMALGTVPVVSDVGDLASYVQPVTAGMAVPADQPTVLAETLIHLLTHPEQRQVMATAARQRVEQYYTLPILAGQLADFLQSRVARKGAQR